ncbi:MAG: glycosyltransferase family 1 protein [Deltaproteobacteria bacterium]|nr:glycosyltransferase family 1 protein [Deltaproteobacteria bacterium]
MNILFIGTPKRDALNGVDFLVLGLQKIGVDFDHYPNILRQSYGHTGTYQLKFDNVNISYPEYGSMVRKLKSRQYDLIITTVCHADYKGGRHGLLSRISRKIKYSLESNKYKMGGTLVVDWLKQGIQLPPIVVIDDLDDPFIHRVDYDLLENCALYFKRELPFNRFLCFRLFKLANKELMDFAAKLRPFWFSYDLDSIAVFTDIDKIRPFSERDIDITFLGGVYMSYTRQMILPLLDRLETKYKVISPKSGRRSKSEFYELLKRSKICISPDGRSWDTPKHYELLLCGGLVFYIRPTIELAIGLKDGENCAFIDNDLKNMESLADYYLSHPAKSAEIAQKGYEFAKDNLSNVKLAEYVLEKTKEVIAR